MASTYKPVSWNEVFLNLSDDGFSGNRFFDRNRFFLGLRKDFYDSFIEFGYLNQYATRSSGDLMEHLGVLYVFF